MLTFLNAHSHESLLGLVGRDADRYRSPGLSWFVVALFAMGVGIRYSTTTNIVATSRTHSLDAIENLSGCVLELVPE